VIELRSDQRAALQAIPAGVGSRNRLKFAFTLCGVTQRLASEKTGLSPQRISGLVTGNYQSVSVEEASKLARFFGCTIEDLFPSEHQAVAS
jgi:DNA-binding XRE family transcriptional regulator